jgi:hypothetical protein
LRMETADRKPVCQSHNAVIPMTQLRKLYRQQGRPLDEFTPPRLPYLSRRGGARRLAQGQQLVIALRHKQGFERKSTRVPNHVSAGLKRVGITREVRQGQMQKRRDMRLGWTWTTIASPCTFTEPRI